MSLNVRASRCCSVLPSILARADRSPSATRRAAWSSLRTGPATWPAISAPAPRPSTSTSSPIAISPSVARWVARSTASTLCVTRTAPIVAPVPVSRMGTAVATIVSSSVSLRRSSWNESPPSAASISGREP